jgi:putative mRNA 3-end processing factor
MVTETHRGVSSLLTETSSGLWCPAGRFHIDPWEPVDRAVITHAHGDHARPGSAAYLCASPSAVLLRRRFGADGVIESLPYGQPLTIGDVRLSFHPAGHVLGSAQVRIESNDGVWVVAGDYKRAADPTCAPFEPVRCDTFITESTFGLPIYRWDPTERIIGDIAAWWAANGDAGRTSVLFCYTIGKAQRLLAELSRAMDRTVYVHGMMLGMIDAYRESGVAMLPVAPVIERARGGRSTAASFAGELVLAPLSARGTPWMRRLGDVSNGFASGLMRVRGVRRQRGFDRGFVLSDHADWPALLQTVAETGATRVLATHGHAEPLARYLRERGLESGIIRTAWEGEPSSE